MSNIYEKIQFAKEEVLKANLKKSWKNKFAWYEYFELSDFLPFIVQTCNKLWLFTSVSFNETTATLKVVNCEKTDEVVEITSPMKELELKWCNQIQALGGVETYQRRYLYMSLFDIVENDMFDSTVTEEKKQTVKERLQEMNREEAPKTLKRFFEHIDKVSPDNKNELKRLLEQGRFLYKSEYYSDEEKQKIQEVSVGIKSLLECKDENKWQ